MKLSSEMLSKSTSWEENARVEKRSLPSGGDTLLSGKERSSMGELGEWPKLYADETWPGKRMKEKMVVQQEKKYEQKKPEQMS